MRFIPRGVSISRADFEAGNEDTPRKRAVLSAVSIGIQGVLRLAYSVLIGRSLGPQFLGVTNSAISLVQLVSLIWPAAHSNAASNFVARARGASDPELSASIARHLGRGALLSSTALAVPTGVVAYFLLRDVALAVLTAALLVSFSAYTYSRGLSFALQQVGRLVMLDLVTSLFAMAGLVGVLLLGWVHALLVPLTLGYLVFALIAWPWTARARDPLAPVLRREIRHFIFWVSLGSLATGGLIQLSMVLATTLTHASDAGIYSAALSLATPATMIGSVVSAVLFPSLAFARGRNDDASANKQVDLATRGLVAVVGGAMGLLALLAGPLLVLLYGPEFAAAAPAMALLLAGGFATTIAVPSANALLATSRDSVRLGPAFSLIGTALGVAIVVLAAPGLSTIGVALGVAVGSMVSGLAPIAYVWRRRSLRWGGLATRLVIGFAVTAGIVVAIEVTEGGIVAVAAGTAGFIALWGALMWPEFRMLASLRK